MENDTEEGLEDEELEAYAPYKPLQRPISHRPMDTKAENELSDTSESEGEDSDSDLSILKNAKRSRPQQKSKYSVWTTGLQESELMDDICKLDPGLKNVKMDTSRDVESYYCFTKDDNDDDSDDSDTVKKGNIKDRLGKVNSASLDCLSESEDTKDAIQKVSIKERLGNCNSTPRCFPPKTENGPSSVSKVSIKRRLGEANFSCQRMERPVEEAKCESQPRLLSALKVTPTDSIEDVAQEIINRLCEEKEDLVLRIVRILGQKKAIDLFEKTKTIEEGGGMMVMNGSRRRTPGGVYLLLIKKEADITQKQRREIFEDEKKAEVRNRKNKSKASRLQKVNQLKRSLSLLEDKELPGLPTRKEAVLQEMQCSSQQSDETELELVKNPPPSPATEGDLAEDRDLCTYDDDDIFNNDIECDIEFM